jgi:hypothetical protein
MERHFSTGVVTIVALMAARRAASDRNDIWSDGGEAMHVNTEAEAKFAAKQATPRDVVGDWLSRLCGTQPE